MLRSIIAVQEWCSCLNKFLVVQVAGTSGTLRVEDFVIPRNEKVAQFQVRDGQFLAENATRVSQAAEERTVSGCLPVTCHMRLCSAAQGPPSFSGPRPHQASGYCGLGCSGLEPGDQP